MKKLKKYASDHDKNFDSLKLESYLEQSKSIISQGDNAKIFSKKNIPLAGLVPLVAASLVPAAVSAQCDVAIFDPSNNVAANVAGAGGNEMTIDVDGDGTIDFEIDISLGTAGGGSPALGDLFLQPKNGAEVLCYAVGGGYFYATKFDTNDAIESSGMEWKDGPSLNGGQCTLDYQSNGAWHGGGVVTGYVGFRINDDQLGFMEVVYETGVEVTITPTLTGVQSAGAGPVVNSIEAGVCLALPVELSSFTAETRGDRVSLKWTTETEINNEGFEIQRSMNGRDFAKIDWVRGQGNSSSAIDYVYEDDISLNTQYYYRLKQIDYDGRYSLSDVRTVISREGKGIVLHDIVPNPISDNQARVNISANTEEQLTLNIFDALGQLVSEQSVSLNEGTNTINLNIEALPNGSYFVKLNGKEHASYKKMVIAK